MEAGSCAEMASMSDHYYAYTVVLERDVRDDDAEHITHALKMIKGVASVKPHVADTALMAATMRAKSSFRDKLYELVKDCEM